VGSPSRRRAWGKKGKGTSFSLHGQKKKKISSRKKKGGRKRGGGPWDVPFYFVGYGGEKKEERDRNLRGGGKGETVIEKGTAGSEKKKKGGSRTLLLSSLWRAGKGKSLQLVGKGGEEEHDNALSSSPHGNSKGGEAEGREDDPKKREGPCLLIISSLR